MLALLFASPVVALYFFLCFNEAYLVTKRINEALSAYKVSNAYGSLISCTQSICSPPRRTQRLSLKLLVMQKAYFEAGVILHIIWFVASANYPEENCLLGMLSFCLPETD